MAKRAKRLRHFVWRFRLRTRITGLWVRNRLSRVSVSGGAGPVVSMTSHGARVDSVHLTIESIGRGDLTPRRLILWLDDRDVTTELPRSLVRLIRRGLEVRHSENFGPHTKYYPYVEQEERFEAPLVTADDDIVYPSDWLSRLRDANRKTPGEIVCYRARRIAFTGDGLAPYEEWDFVTSQAPSLANFATGVAGVVYPEAFLGELKRRGRDFMDACRAADDVWLHHTALISGHPIRQIDRVAARFPVIDSTQPQGLKHENVAGGRNDALIAAVYSADDVAALRSHAGGVLGSNG